MKRKINNSDEKLRGRIAKVFYSSPRFTAGALETSQGLRVRFKGALLVQENDRVVLRGRWITDPTYGRQFEVKRFEYDMDLDAEGLAHYLANHPEIKGIGPVKARAIAEKFGGDFENAIEKRLDEIVEVARISKDTAVQLREVWKRTRELNLALTWLSSFGLTFHGVTTVVNELGNNAVALLKDNPYQLVELLPGFGFRRVDQLAMKMGLPKDDRNRIEMGLLYCVDEAIRNGDCWVERPKLLKAAQRLLVLDTLDAGELIGAALEDLVESEKLVAPEHFGSVLVSRPWLYRLERSLYERFAEAAAPNPHFQDIGTLAALIKAASPTLNARQAQAVEEALSHRISVISGAAGTGKSYTLATIVRMCRDRCLTVKLAAPTGKAAKRMEEVIGHRASTIHRLLGYNGHKFAHDSDLPIAADVIILDELGMTDVPLAARFFDAVDLEKTAVVLAGDHNQLPPVGPGSPLRDLIDCRAVPLTILTKVMRQAGELRLNSKAILDGTFVRGSKKLPDGGKPWIVADRFKDPMDVQDYIIELFDNVLENKLEFDLIKEVQLITPTHKGPLGTRELNVRLQKLLQKKLWGRQVPDLKPGQRPRLYPHDKVIQTRNNYELEVMNGAVGYVVEAEADGALAVDFEGQVVEIPAGSAAVKDLELALATSIHKVQGSEFPCVICVIHKAHSFMSHRNLFYTAVTRAQKTVIIVGDRWGMRHCAEKEVTSSRASFLPLWFGESASTASVLDRWTELGFI